VKRTAVGKGDVGVSVAVLVGTDVLVAVFVGVIVLVGVEVWVAVFVAVGNSANAVPVAATWAT
jgi:hypothetical protein